MATSEARIAANRRNAAKSTGPKTPEGKAICRRNAVKHGLTGAGVALPEPLADRVRAIADELTDLYDARDERGEMLTEQAALAMARLKGTSKVESEDRHALAERAAACWDEDRTAEAARLGDRLAGRPARVVAELRRTVRGCDWLIERFEALVFALDRDGDTDAHLGRLAELLGIDPDLRPIDRRLDPAAPTADRLAAIRDELKTLRGLRNRLADLDESDRDATAAGHRYEHSTACRRLMSYEAACHRRLRWAMGELERLHTAKPPKPAPRSSIGWPSEAAAPSPAAPRTPAAARPSPSAPAPVDAAPSPSSRPAPIAPSIPTPGQAPTAPRNRRERRQAAARARRESKARRRSPAAG